MRFGSKITPVFALAFGIISSAQATILPPNNLYLEDNIHRRDANITETMFKDIIAKTIDYYQPIVASHNAKLVHFDEWTDATVNAYANQSGSTWEVHMFGGLARRPEITPDGFQLVLCHELGHHLAGFVFNKGGIFSRNDWAAVEGQSDYFATHSCARELWSNDLEENAAHASTVDAVAKKKCDTNWESEKDRNLCYRVADGGQSLGNLLSKLGGGELPSFGTPDPTKVGSTYSAHPRGQCRLDTYLAGALCTRDFDRMVIPARKHKQGQASKAAEQESAKYTCHSADSFTDSVRPLCWFKPGI